MKIGIFGGSFDPVHKEHVRLAEAAIKGLSLDKLIVVPAGVPPHKQGKRLAPAEDRLQMCKIAFQNMEKVEISDYEISKEGASYTYLTCQHFAKTYKGATLFWLVGTDMFWDFFNWKNPEIILSIARLAVCRRNEGVENIAYQQKRFFMRFAKNFEIIPYNGEAVSSTEIRTRSILNMDFSHLVPVGLTEYIKNKKLYTMPAILQGLALEKPSRAAHSKRVCLMAVQNAKHFGVDEVKTLVAAALHDVTKNLPIDDERLKGFTPPQGVPEPVLHQYTGAYLLENTFSVKDEDVLNAVRYHTSGRAGMSALEKLIFLCDLLEEERDFPHIQELRQAFQEDLDKCMYLSLKYQIEYLKERGTDIYPLTLQAFQYYQEKIKEKI